MPACLPLMCAPVPLGASLWKYASFHTGTGAQVSPVCPLGLYPPRRRLRPRARPAARIAAGTVSVTRPVVPLANGTTNQ